MSIKVIPGIQQLQDKINRGLTMTHKGESELSKKVTMPRGNTAKRQRIISTEEIGPGGHLSLPYYLFSS